MKRIYSILSLGALLLLSSSCTDLSEHIYSKVPMDDFFTSEKNLVANAGRAYTKLQGYNKEQGLWTLQLQLSDECAVPATATGSWYSGGRYEELQVNRVPASNRLVKRAWDWTFDGIAAANEIIYEMELSPIEFEGKTKFIAEMKALRAYFYYQAIATWGNVPFTVDYTQTGSPEQRTRREVFDFLVTELSPELIAQLDDAPAANNYGRVTQSMVHCLLAKMYLNAEAWFGTAMYDKALEHTRAVLSSRYYIIEPDYATNFSPANEVSRENIFAIVYDSAAIPAGSKAFYLFTLTLEPESCATFNIPGEPWSGFVCQPDFFQSYASTDRRLAQSWLYGPQFTISGAPIMVDGTQMSYNPIFPERSYFNANGGRQKFDGARCCKWAYQTDGLLTSGESCMNNDFAIFRLADVALMQAEALLRMGKVGEAAAIPELKDIRNRAGLEPFTASTLTLETLYAERGRELAWEGWRHEDMIRFGKYLKAYWAHPDQSAETHRLLLPIPTDILNANPKLKQNPGY